MKAINLDNSLIKLIQLKKNKNNKEKLLNRSNNNNNKNIISINYNNNLKNNESILLNSNIFSKITDNSKILNKSININPILIIKNTNLSDSSTSKRKKNYK